MNHKIIWPIAIEAHIYTCGSRKCDLPSSEKIVITKANSVSLLNKHDELISKGQHMNRFNLKYFKNR